MQLELPIMAVIQASEAASHQQERIARHYQSLRCCWPEWHGPRVESSIHGRCSVHSLMAHNLTHGDSRYHYMAPCIIESISADGTTLTAVIDYPTHTNHPGIRSCAALYNGQRLRLHITDVWAPVQEIIAPRKLQVAA